MQFYSMYIHHFEPRITPLRKLTINHEYTSPVAPIWTDADQHALNDLKGAILSTPCLMHFNHKRLVVIRTNFSSKGFGYVVCQPGTDVASKQAMAAYRAGKDFAFMMKESSAVLRPVAFGGRRCRGNKVCLHSHLGKGFAGDWAINKNLHMLFGTQFVWATDCYAVRFILSYDGNNPAVLRLQMRLMCWDIDIVHQNDTHLTNADYWSCLGKDICFNPHFREYLQFDSSLRAEFPAPTALPMLPQNMPYYHGPRIPSQNGSSVQDADAAYCQALISTITSSKGIGLTHLPYISVWFGDFDTVTPSDAHVSTNHKIPGLAQQTLQFSWAVYSFGGGHFVSTISSHNLSFCVKIACNQYELGRVLFREFTLCPRIFNSGNEMLDHICASDDISQIHGYLILFLCFKDSDTTSLFWQLQGTIVAQLRSLRDLQVVVAIVLPDHDGRCVTSVVTSLKSKGWRITHSDVSYPDQGDTIAGACQVLIGVHTSCASIVEPIFLKEPPPTSTGPIVLSIWEPFNWPEHSVSLAKDDEDFCWQDVCFATTEPLTPSGSPNGVYVKYFLHHSGSDDACLSGSAVISTAGLCPPFDACPNTNMFQHLFGIKFAYKNHTHVRGISPFEFA